MYPMAGLVQVGLRTNIEKGGQSAPPHPTTSTPASKGGRDAVVVLQQ
jgi:hypothetical protein